tara:strand:+ start:7815 stop:8225 length:411 start_codon:yes stop_codon:yes gene_type:complete
MTKDIKFIRVRQKHLMPEFMKAYEIELASIERPDKLSLTKTEYIQAWVSIFDSTIVRDIDNLQYYMAKFSRSNILQLECAFEWVLTHFAELDLGGNMKWLTVLLDVLKYNEKNDWTTEQESELIFNNISDTRWYDY